MSTKPERPIERLLRACGRQRRDASGPPLQLHPANRRLLQAAVAGRQSESQATSWRSEFIARFWPRFAWSLALAALVAVIAVIVMPGTHPRPSTTLMAKQDAAPPQTRESEPTAPPAMPVPAEPRDSKEQAVANRPNPPSGAPALTPLDKDAVRYQSKAEQEVAANSLPAKRLDMAPGAGGGVAPQTDVAADSVMRQRSLAIPAPPPSAQPSPPSPVPTASPSTAAVDRSLSLASQAPVGAAQGNRETLDAAVAGEARTVQRFVQTGRRNSLSAPKPVLRSFQIEQAGGEFRVIDEDGSVYSGAFQPLAAAPSVAPSSSASRASAPKLKSADTSSSFSGSLLAENTQPGPAYFFQVSGTNRTLNQRIVFSGSFLPTNRPAFTSGNSSLARRFGDASSLSPSQAITGLWSHIPGKLIIGRVTVGKEPEQTINASPVP